MTFIIFGDLRAPWRLVKPCGCTKKPSRRGFGKLRNVVTWMITVSMIGVYMYKGRDAASVEQVVVRPPAQVYAELDRLYTDIERKAATSSPVFGGDRKPVELTFRREPGERLELKATAGFKTAYVKTWIAPGPTPEQTRLKVSVYPEAMLDRTGISDVHTAVEAVLRQTENQLGVGKPLPALFGISANSMNMSRDYGSSYDRNAPNVDPGSTRPMLDVRRWSH